MSIYRKLGGTVYQPVSIYRKLGGTVHPIREVWRKVGGVVHLVWSALSASASPGSISGTSAPGTVTSNTTTLTITGGSGNYFIEWGISGQSGDPILVTPTNPNGLTTAVSGGFASGQFAQGQLFAIVTDTDTMAIAQSNNVSWFLSSP